MSRYTLVLLTAWLLSGCVAATKVVRNEQAEIKKDYSEVYLIPPKSDPRDVVPKVVDEFQKLGFNVRVADREKPIGGGQGTGFLITRNGHVLTCAHVIGEEKEATLWLSGVRYEADVVAKNKETDLALLKIRNVKSLDVTPVSLRENKNYSMGEEVYTIGFPLSSVLGNTARLTKGLISAAAGMKDDPNQVQITAPVQPGNSGGPLFDSQGSVLGVVQKTLINQQVGGPQPQNVNFAIKSDVALKYLKTTDKAVYDAIKRNQIASIEKVSNAVVKVRSGIVSEELESKSKLVAVLEYHSIWDLWFRFRLFVISFYDLDSQQFLFAAGQGRDNLVSTQDVVIKKTFEEIRKTLNKPVPEGQTADKK